MTARQYGRQELLCREPRPHAARHAKSRRPAKRVLQCGRIGVVVLVLLAGLTACLSRPAPGHNHGLFEWAVKTPTVALAGTTFKLDAPGVRGPDAKLKLDSNGVIKCSETGCGVTVDVTNEVTSGANDTRVVGGQITAELTITVEIEGRPAGSCTDKRPLPLNATGRLSCEDPEAGPIFAAVYAEKQAQAESESEAEEGAQIPFTINYVGRYLVYATAQVDTLRDGQQPRQETLRAQCGIDPATGSRCLAIPDATHLDEAEQATAARLLRDPSYTGGKLKESPDKAYDYVDQYNRTYDAIGQPDAYKANHWNEKKFLASLDVHVLGKQGLNFTVLDLTGANSRQMDVIFAHIDGMNAAQKSTIIIVGD